MSQPQQNQPDILSFQVVNRTAGKYGSIARLLSISLNRTKSQRRILPVSLPLDGPSIAWVETAFGSEFVELIRETAAGPLDIRHSSSRDQLCEKLALDFAALDWAGWAKDANVLRDADGKLPPSSRWSAEEIGDFGAEDAFDQDGSRFEEILKFGRDCAKASRHCWPKTAEAARDMAMGARGFGKTWSVREDVQRRAEAIDPEDPLTVAARKMMALLRQLARPTRKAAAACADAGMVDIPEPDELADKIGEWSDMLDESERIGAMTKEELEYCRRQLREMTSQRAFDIGADVEDAQPVGCVALEIAYQEMAERMGEVEGEAKAMAEAHGGLWQRVKALEQELDQTLATETADAAAERADFLQGEIDRHDSCGESNPDDDTEVLEDVRECPECGKSIGAYDDSCWLCYMGATRGPSIWKKWMST